MWNFFNFNCLGFWRPQCCGMPYMPFTGFFQFNSFFPSIFSPFNTFPRASFYSPSIYNSYSSYNSIPYTGSYLGSYGTGNYSSYYADPYPAPSYASSSYSFSGSYNAPTTYNYSSAGSSLLDTFLTIKAKNSTPKETETPLVLPTASKGTESNPYANSGTNTGTIAGASTGASAKGAPIKTSEFSKYAVCTGTLNGDKVVYKGITHYKYNDCPASRLVSMGNNQSLRDDAAKAFKEMQAAAKRDGISLFVASGFRSIAYQKTVFPKKFTNKTNPTDAQLYSRLKESAPAGYSEHHTGLAVDINSTSSSFANTKEYRWLKTNARRFGFELSFPENNKQGLIFEPWHFRFVGKNNENAAIFANARSNA